MLYSAYKERDLKSYFSIDSLYFGSKLIFNLYAEIYICLYLYLMYRQHSWYVDLYGYRNLEMIKY